MNLGWLDVCLNVEDVAVSRTYYEKLGFQTVEGNADEGYWVMTNGTARIGLYTGAFEGFMLNFRGEDVMANAEALAAKGLAIDSGPALETDGSAGATLIDPDGNIIYLNTHPSERDPAYQKKIGVL